MGGDVRNKVSVKNWWNIWDMGDATKREEW
jgi:hypothetical protein